MSALKWAQRACQEGDYDTCALLAGHAAQLYLKSLIYRVTGEEVRVQGVRELLWVLAAALVEQGAEDFAREVSDYMRAHKRELAELSDAHTRAAYGLTGYGEKEAKLLLRVAEQALEELRRLEERLFG
ncbi:HEPN domain-containing protein [Infirmifilum sp. SLHALR2]